VFENTVPRRTFRIKRDEVAGGWRRLHNGELHKLYTPQDIIRVNEMDEACSTHGRDEKCVEYFVWKI
jgi:hypothetical protein